MKAPFLSKKFSKFENILTPHAKRTGAIFVMLAIILAGTINLLVGQKGDVQKISAVVTEDTSLYFDSALTAPSYEIKSGDLVGILYKNDDNVYYVRRAVTEVPSPEGYISKDMLSFDFDEANQGIITTDIVYDAPLKDRGNPEIDAKGKVCTINEWLGDWRSVSLPGGIDGVWVMADDISYDIVFDASEQAAGGFYKQIKAYLQKKYTEAYKPYYDSTIVEYLSNYKEVYDENANTLEATFVMNGSHRNYYKDPDTVKYIQDAKKDAENKGNEYYQKLYNTYYTEYNQIKSSNYVLKLTANTTDGRLDEYSIRMYTDDGITNNWYELENGFGSYIID